MADTKVIDAEPEPPMPDSVHWLSTRITPVVAMVCMFAVVHSVVVAFLLLFRWTVVSNWCFGLDCCTV